MSRLSERVENFNKAFDMLERTYRLYLGDKDNEAYQLAIIQGFEIVFELSWKVMKDLLKTKGVITSTPRDTIKQAFVANILPSAQVWIDMINDRNFSSHEYNIRRINDVLEKFTKAYYDEIMAFHEFVKGL
ncbi:MAG: nucleotidyltransferase substrate binding protein [Candidatus Gastranaerophilales bacterium]|nr:nucleotidyltransferase substrate binding protein [Candidatus Gastranaerophilales bacterium]